MRHATDSDSPDLDRPEAQLRGRGATVREFYDLLAPSYAAAISDWDGAVDRQARVLEALIADRVPRGSRVLDCAAGIGTQALGLAARGYHVTATDLSSAALDRAAAEALGRGVHLDTAVCDMRSLPDRLGTFDAVICCDNSIAHVRPDDLTRTFTSMAARLRPAGLLVLSLRDYDRHRRARPAISAPHRSCTRDGETVALQTWDWVDADSYVASQLLLRRRHDEDWVVDQVADVLMHAHARADLARHATQAGFAVRWLSPEQTTYHQNVMVAERVVRS
ncbi:MAG TPA: class I SAM-dependent methyltransferase [Gemmatimonadaceae bacterium]|nr:class I SAM-dependent methyltransferase [Gemmatimonadaceae bacterium]